MKYKTLNEHYREKFGSKVYKLSLDGGFTCPNRDGTLGIAGCIFCSGSAEFAGVRSAINSGDLAYAERILQSSSMRCQPPGRSNS